MLIKSLLARIRSRRQLRGKSYEKHSDTLISVIGPGTVVIPDMLVRDTEQGDRNPAGSTDTIQLGRGNNEECNQGDICKFINIHVMFAPRVIDSAQSTGWLEWAFCIMKGSDPEPTKANIGTNTLGDIMTKYLRNGCIYTGSIPCGSNQCATAEITLKIPKAKQRLVLGDVWRFFFLPRTISSTETSTSSFKVITSFNYKNYH